MSLSDLAAIGSFLSGIAVVISFVFLTLQMRQSAQNQRATIHNERTALVQELNLAASVGGAAEIVVRGNAVDETLTDAERWQFLITVLSALWIFEEVYYQHKDGMLDDSRWDQNVRRLSFFLQIPGWRAAWHVYKAMFKPDFSGWFDSMLETTPLLADPGAHLATWAEFGRRELVRASRAAMPV
jgi:hypothetical protein